MNRRLFLARTVSLAAGTWFLSGCGGGGAKSSAPSWATSTRTGRAILPPRLAPTPAFVVGLTGGSRVAADGSFSMSFASASAMLTRCEDAAGHWLLIGFLSDARPDLSVRSTAEALLFFALGLFAQPQQARWQTLELLRSEDVSAIETAIESAIAANGPGWMTSPGMAQVGAAVRATVSRIVDAGPARSGRAANSRGMIVTPTERVSGLQVEGDGIGSVTVTNSFRRSILLFSTATASRLDEGPEFPLPDAWIQTELEATDGLSSPIDGLANLSGGGSFYQPKTVTVPTPRNPADARYTKHRVFATGFGFSKGAWDVLPESLRHDAVVGYVRTFLEKFLAPLLISGIMPIFNKRIDKAAPILHASDALKDVANMLVATPGFLNLLLAGKPADALLALWEQIKKTDSIQLLLLGVLNTALTALNNGSNLALDVRSGKLIAMREFIDGFWSGIDQVLDIGEMAFTLFDSVVQLSDFASSSLVETWEILVTNAKVQLSPTEIFVRKNALVSGLAITLPGATAGDGRFFGYSWKCGAGKLRIGDKYDSVIDSTISATGDFDAIGMKAGDSTTIEITAFLRGQGTNEPLGSAKATVYATDVTIAPSTTRIKSGEQATFTPALIGMRPLKSGEKIDYKFTTTRNAGELLGSPDGGTNIPAEGNTAIYRAATNREGQDTVTVKAYFGTFLLGEATATVTVGGDTITVPGSWKVVTVDNGGGRVGVGAQIFIPKIEGAKRYSVYAHGFNDPAYYGTEYRGGWTMPYVPSDYADQGAVYMRGMAGWNGPAEDEAGAVAYYTARFAGMVVDVTVTL